jgi:hypothetical protein
LNKYGRIRAWPPSLRLTPAEVSAEIDSLLNSVNTEASYYGTVSLATGTAATTVSNTIATATSFIDFMPTTEAAALAMINLDTPLYVSSRTDGSFVISHAISATADRSLVYFIHPEI